MEEEAQLKRQPEVVRRLRDDRDLPPEVGRSGGRELARTLGYRFLFSYFVLYSFPAPLGMLPWTEKVTELYQQLVDPIVLWVGANLLGIDHPIGTEINGSGDRTYDYVLLFCQLVLAIAATATWSLLDRRGRPGVRVLEGLRLYLRVVVGGIMLSYGFAKIFPSQFVPPDPGQLMKTYGESSPMNLLWTFMGFSPPYTMFAGFMEAIPGAICSSGAPPPWARCCSFSSWGTSWF